jgi:hypothetical protein
MSLSTRLLKHPLFLLGVVVVEAGVVVVVLDGSTMSLVTKMKLVEEVKTGTKNGELVVKLMISFLIHTKVTLVRVMEEEVEV